MKTDGFKECQAELEAILGFEFGFEQEINDKGVDLKEKDSNEDAVSDGWNQIAAICGIKQEEKDSKEDDDFTKDFWDFINGVGQKVSTSPEDNRQCREENKEKIKSYYEANKEKKIEYQRQYREANKEKIKSYYEANKEKINEKRSFMNDLKTALSYAGFEPSAEKIQQIDNYKRSASDQQRIKDLTLRNAGLKMQVNLLSEIIKTSIKGDTKCTHRSKN